MLDEQVAVYCFDIDGTICETDGTDYESAKPKWEEIQKIRECKEEGNRIVFYTARGSVSGIDHRELTERQLNSWGVPFDELVFGKPAADRYIDNKAMAAEQWAHKQSLQIYGVKANCKACGCLSAIAIVNIPGLDPHLVRIGEGDTRTPQEMGLEVGKMYAKLGWVIDSPEITGKPARVLTQTFASQCAVCSGEIFLQVQTDTETMKVAGIVLPEVGA